MIVHVHAQRFANEKIATISQSRYNAMPIRLL
jgi:hypothetical protein